MLIDLQQCNSQEQISDQYKKRFISNKCSFTQYQTLSEPGQRGENGSKRSTR